MKAHVVRHWDRDLADIFLFTEGPSGRRYYTLDGHDMLTATDVAQGDVAPLFVSLPTAFAEALGKALATLPGADDATVRHLDDAIKVRDRLLTLVERP